ncbi:MAG: hypothetical protein OEY38_19700 [Gammaproteobacteria bacterium]|nr:hypothetical protein [Gammaproteobacteria bacterium]
MRSFGVLACSLLIIGGGLTACRFHNANDPLVLSGEFPIVYVKRSTEDIKEPLKIGEFKPGADLFVRDLSSASIQEKNLTSRLTLGKADVMQPESSYDGKRIIFSMQCGAESVAECAHDETWNIWEYNFETDAFRRVIADGFLANVGHDFDPAYLPDGRIVFSSTRQQATHDQIGYLYKEQYSEQIVQSLHVMRADGSQIQQITFSQSIDKNPVVLMNGKIMFSRWEQEGERSQVVLYSVNPDGSEFQLLYGAHSTGKHYAHARQMLDGRIIATVMPVRGTFAGGSVNLINVTQYADDVHPLDKIVLQAEQAISVQKIPVIEQVSAAGRFAYAYPLNDGSRQVLVSYGQFKPVEEIDPDTKQKVLNNEKEAAPDYALYMVNVDTKAMRPIVLPQSGVAHIEATPVSPRPRPSIYQPIPVRDTGVFDGQTSMGILHIRSVYDTDEHGRMSNGVLSHNEIVQKPIPLSAVSANSYDPRDLIADIAALKDPTQTKAEQRPARFIRVSQANPLPENFRLLTKGATPYSMQRIIGYAPIEPDGSVRVRVPAETPLSLAVLDDKGRAYEHMNSWIQVRVGEEFQCNGCHAPPRAKSLNSTPIAGVHANTQLRSSQGNVLQANSQYLDNETMAQSRTRLDPLALALSDDLLFEDVWTQAGINFKDGSARQLDPPVQITYGQLTTEPPSNGVINYMDHIQPLWEKNNQSGQACVTCHNDQIDDASNPNGLDLRAGNGALDGTTVSYSELINGTPELGEDRRPIVEKINNRLVVRQFPPLVKAGFSRQSFLIEKLFNQELFASRGLKQDGLDHSQMFNPSELRLITEWIDLGALFVNNPFDASGELQGNQFVLDKDLFRGEIFGLLRALCASCHKPSNITGVVLDIQNNFFILTGDVDQDYLSAATFVTDINNPDNSYLLSLPSSTTAHPLNAINRPVMANTSSAYSRIRGWIETATGN